MLEIFCYRCQEQKKAEVAVFIGMDQICTACLAGLMVDKMKMPEFEKTKKDIKAELEEIGNRVNAIEEKIKSKLLETGRKKRNVYDRTRTKNTL